jgi:hypothetical protein
MNDSQIEKMLRRAPQSTPPPDLLGRLQEDIALPKLARSNPEQPRFEQHPLRRWIPAFAFGLILLSCLVIIGMQANVVSQIKQRNEELRAAMPNLEELRQQHAESERLQGQREELDQLRRDNQDLLRLRAEVAQLRNLRSELDLLRAENQRLAANAAALNRRVVTPAGSESEDTPEKAASTACVNNLKQLGLAVRTSALDNEDRFPSTIVQFTNELGTPKILICPSDTGKQQFAGVPWSEFRPDMTSYQLILSGTNDDVFPMRIIAKCPIHGHILLADGSVQRIADAIRSGRAREVMINGRLTLEFPAENRLGGSSNAPAPSVEKKQPAAAFE